MVAKNQRQYRIAKILQSQQVAAQVELVTLLAEDGIIATQATVSRDLDELGAIKVKGFEGESVYAIPELPKDQSSTFDHLKRVMGEWVVEISVSGNLVILRTPPGCAHVVASALDRSRIDGLLGTVAGDDTLLAIADQPTSGHILAKRMSELAGISLG